MTYHLLKEKRKIGSKKITQLISIGSLNQMYKSPDTLIHAVRIILDRGRKVKLTWLGDGKFLNEMEQLAVKLNVRDDVMFAGSVSSTDVTNYLDNSDIFLLVSRTEGLPRAVVEAMARGLPCIGTNVGGIPELLEKQVLVETESPQAIADMVEYFIDNIQLREYQSSINLEKAKEYSFEKLNSKRNEFFNFLKFKLNQH